MATNGETGRARRLPSVLLGIGIVVALVATVLLTTGSANPAVALAPNGHWVFNRAEGSVVHVDGGTDKVDARVAVPDAPREPGLTLQSPTQGFLVGRRSVTVFGKSTLTVESTIPTGQDEMPVGIEVAGGPYLVYRQAGTIVRLGTRPTSIPVGGPVERPVYTDDGTVWLHRPDNGTLCALRAAAETLDCAVQTDPGPSGALTVTGDRASFLSTARDAVEPIADGSLGSAVPVGTDVGTDALVADRDTRGRLPELEPAANRMLLLDTAGVAQARAGGGPVPVQLPAGTYTSPVTSDGVVAVVEQTRNHLLTFSVDGRQLADVALPPGEAAQITRGADGRIYVDDADGAATHLVQPDGTVTSVRTGAAPDAVQAAGADRASLVTPPPPRSSRAGSGEANGRDGGLGQITQGGVPGPPGGGTNRSPVTGPQLPQPPQPPQPPANLPPAPTNFTATAQPDGSVETSWQGVPVSGVTYQVRVGGAAAISTFTGGSSAKVTGLAPGKPVTLAVVAVSPAGAGPPSNGVTVTPLGGAVEADAPGGFTGERRNMSGTTIVTLNWTAPALNGAQLVGYEVSGTGIAPFTTTVNGTTYQDNDNYCSPSIRYTVRAITQPAGGGAQTKGKQARTTVSTAVDCTPGLMLDSATPDGSDSATVVLRCLGNGRGGAGGGTVSLSFNGVRKWTGTCTLDYRGDQLSTTARVTDLTAGTTYTVSGTVSTDSGSKQSENTLTVTTPA